ncbi:MarR family transcriptional regulator [Sphingomonas sp. ABOLD]|uniref:MarR family winged helix-turn-helix transcriptional regulator n=1 Tax=Sphingomonas sp. ABOLD TaxID=1985877 RepID=UPI000F7F47FB|nr:MarR family transcriptional regulator [Sphingomonas sp. ABOLD]RSV36826.1 MarR family transcriptional regulator [Sphingomonas sp. ABOLD]
MTQSAPQDDELDTLIGYQLQMARLRLMEAAHAALAPYGISPARVTALALIRAQPGLDQSALGRALSINRASAMKLVNLLVERGLVERRPGRDLRSHALHLTAEGETQLPEMVARLRESEVPVLADLSEPERARLLQLLHRIHAPFSRD